jgi:serine/threonine-protein kinase 24/25/MST4
LPSSPKSPKKYDQQATVRHMPSGGQEASSSNHKREPSDEYEDYDDQYGSYSVQGAVPRQARRTPSEDDLPDTTILDSVILPAIASVSLRFLREGFNKTD